MEGKDYRVWVITEIVVALPGVRILGGVAWRC